MDEAGLDRFVRSLYSDNFDKDAIVLDVRYNGGGFTHDQVLNYLGGKEHTLVPSASGGDFGAVLNFNDRKWSKPMVLLINNRSYSDAEIFPHAFRTLGLGKLVGQATGGLVIGTSEHPADRWLGFRLPRTWCLHREGREHGEGRREPRRAGRTAPGSTFEGRRPATAKSGRGADARRHRMEEDPARRPCRDAGAGQQHPTPSPTPSPTPGPAPMSK